MTSARRRSARTRRDFHPGLSRLEGRELLSGAGPVTFETTSGVPGLNGYYRSPVTLTFTASDPGYAPSQLTTYYRINGGPLTRGNSVTLSGDGFYTVAYVSAEPSGYAGAAAGVFIAIDRTPPTIVSYTSPTTLWPPNHKDVPVLVVGRVTDNFSGPLGFVTYQVVDSEHQDQPAGYAFVDANGFFSFFVDLDSSRAGNDKNGRVYAIDVTAYDRAGNASTTLDWVLVPHDQGNGNGKGNGNG
jgi:hypothetical protein